LCPYFVSEKVISPSDIEQIIKSSTSVAAARLALDKVAIKIKVGKVKPLKAMLLIMEQRGNDVTKILSDELTNKLKMVSNNEDSAVQLEEGMKILYVNKVQGLIQEVDGMASHPPCLVIERHRHTIE